jgi:hypothetical protein
MQLDGWALDRTTKKPARPRKLAPGRVTLVRAKGARVVHAMTSAKFSCANTTVVGRPW